MHLLACFLRFFSLYFLFAGAIFSAVAAAPLATFDATLPNARFAARKLDFTGFASVLFSGGGGGGGGAGGAALLFSGDAGVGFRTNPLLPAPLETSAVPCKRRSKTE